MSNTLRSSDDALLEAIEQYLARLESLIGEYSSSVVFFNELSQGLVRHCGAKVVSVWIRERERTHCLFSSSEIQATLSPELQLKLFAAADRHGSRILSVESSGGEHTEPRLLSSRQINPGSNLVLDIRFGSNETLFTTEQLRDIVDAVTELAVSFSLRARLELMQTKLVEQQQINRILAVSAQTGSLEETTQTLAAILLDILQCDRVSIFQVTATGSRPLAVVPAANLNQRSSQLEILRQLTIGMMAEKGWLLVRVGEGIDVPHSIKPMVEQYLQASLARELWGFSTCLRREDEGLGSNPSEAVVIVERFVLGEPQAALPRLENVAQFSQPSSPEMTPPSSSHNEIILAMALDTLADNLARRNTLALRIADQWRTSTFLRRALLFSLAVIVVILSLFLIPAPLEFSAEGSIQPRSSQTIFATRQGVVEKLLVQNGESVEAGQPLLMIRSPELELELYELTGKVETLEAKLLSLRSAKIKQGSERANEAALRLSAEEEDVKIQLLGLRKQLDIVTADKESLTLLSPLAGIVDGWDMEQTLAQRPVAHGQRLLRIFTPEEGWQLELEIPNDTSGFVLEAQQNAPCKVEFRVRSDPSTRYLATLSSVSQTIQINAEQQAVLLAKVDLLEEPVEVTRAGALVVAQIHCGRSTLGFIWFREILDFLQRSFWF